MREKFKHQLNKLNHNLIKMGNAVSTHMEMSVEALIKQDHELAQQVIDRDDEIDEMERTIEKKAMKIILLQQPVAKDFWLVSASLKMITDMERISDQAAHISELTMRLCNIKLPQLFQDITDLGHTVAQMLRNSMRAFAKGDLSIVNEVYQQDKLAEEHFNKLKKDLVEVLKNGNENPEVVIDLLMIARYLECIGGHAENIAQWVRYSITGTKS